MDSTHSKHTEEAPNTVNDIKNQIDGVKSLLELMENAPDSLSSKKEFYTMIKNAAMDLVPVECRNRSAEQIRESMINNLIKEIDTLIFSSSSQLEDTAIHHHKLYDNTNKNKNMIYVTPVLEHFRQKGYNTEFVETKVLENDKEVLKKVIIIQW